MRSLNQKYLPAVDELRAIAALLVLFFHGIHHITFQLRFNRAYEFVPLKADNPFEALLFEGNTGVTLFMVLSGFIFTYGSYNKKLKYKPFLINRVLRTYPLFLFLIFFGISLYPNSFDFTAFLQTLFFMSNKAGALHPQTILEMVWSLAVEWKFYFLFPLILYFLQKKGIQTLFAILVLFLTFRICAFLLNNGIREVVYWTIFGRLDQFIIGMLIAVLYLHWQVKRIRALFILLMATNAILYGLFLFNQSGGWSNDDFWLVFHPLLEGSAWGLFVFGYLNLMTKQFFLYSIFLRYIGQISYSIYLIHFMIIYIMLKQHWFIYLELTPEKSALLTTLCFVLPLTILISSLTYLLIEKPFLEFRVKY